MLSVFWVCYHSECVSSWFGWGPVLFFTLCLLCWCWSCPSLGSFSSTRAGTPSYKVDIRIQGLTEHQGVLSKYLPLKCTSARPRGSQTEGQKRSAEAFRDLGQSHESAGWGWWGDCYITEELVSSAQEPALSPRGRGKPRGAGGCSTGRRALRSPVGEEEGLRREG